MSLKKIGKYFYGDSQLDIKDELLRYSKKNNYIATNYFDCICKCKNNEFNLLIDDGEGVAICRCVKCTEENSIADSEEYIEDAELEECECPCGCDVFEVTTGVALYQNSNDVKWLYVGCRCIGCGLTACYGDWKNEGINLNAFSNPF
jgi:hypothetical protein